MLVLVSIRVQVGLYINADFMIAVVQIVVNGVDDRDRYRLDTNHRSGSICSRSGSCSAISQYR